MVPGRGRLFLGRSRPSLIEATIEGALAGARSQAFWGVRAPASLKPRGEAARPAPARVFLGRSRPSLIEARGRGGRAIDAEPRDLSGAFAPQPH